MPSAQPERECTAPVLPPGPVVLRALRQARGITREGRAARLGYSAKTVQRWERGEATPDVAAEAALVTLLREDGLLRSYTVGPLRGHTLTEESLRQLLEGGRLQGRTAGHQQEVVQPADDLLPQAPHRSLPSPLTSFVGRDRELANLTSLLATARLLTLTGPGGSGKTRLALALAARLRPDFPEGVIFVALAALTDPDLVVTSIAEALGVPGVAHRPLVHSLVNVLQDKRLLLVLDNFEQVRMAAPLLTELLQGCAELTVVVTSRAALRLSGEQEFPVPPLALPKTGATIPLEALAQHAAVALFCQRAAAVQPDFALTAANAATVAEICVRLDGLPLALELAAARLKLLSPSALLAQLGRCFSVLTGGPRDAPQRQQTLLDTIAWSYDLLASAEQQLFTRLAVFVGGFTLAAAEAVCSGGRDLAVFDGLAALVDQSLLRRDEAVADEPRFSMLETIREFAAELLAAGSEQPVLRGQHLDFFLELAQQTVPPPTAVISQPALQRLAAEQGNVRAALRWGP